MNVYIVAILSCVCIIVAILSCYSLSQIGHCLLLNVPRILTDVISLAKTFRYDGYEYDCVMGMMGMTVCICCDNSGTSL